MAEKAQMIPDAFTFTINGEPTEIDTVWAHLKRPSAGPYSAYCLRVSAEIASLIFGEKPDGLAWEHYIVEHIHEFGTFVVDGYVSTLTRLVGRKRGVFAWVIITVDNVQEESGMICLRGKSEPFKRNLEPPELKPLK
jgi:hypothetical protein